MRNSDWVERLERDLELGQEAVQKARLHPEANEYRRLLSLGLRLKSTDFSGESRAFHSTLDELLERHARQRRTLLQKLPALAVQISGVLLLVVLSATVLLLIPRLPEMDQAMGPIAPDPTNTANPEIRSMMAQEHLDLINLALQYESWQSVYSYERQLRVPTKISGIWEAPYMDTMPGRDERQVEIGPQTMVKVVRLEGYWYETIIEPENEWVTKLLEVVWAPEHEIHLYGAASGEPPFNVSANDVPSSYVPITISTEVVHAINAALVVESWLPHVDPFVGPTRIERVVSIDPAQIASLKATIFEEGMQLDVAGEIWAVRMTGKWKGSPEMNEQAQERGAEPGEFDQLIVFIEPGTYERLGWSIASFDRHKNFYDISDYLNTYTVSEDSSLFDISDDAGLDPDIVAWMLWDHEGLMPHELEEGMQLLLPPSEGVLHVWRPLDTLELVAQDYGVEPQAIRDEPANASHVIGYGFVPDAGDVIFIPMARSICDLEARIPGYIRCKSRDLEN
ncbi:MAG: hypothetical protein ACLFWD_08445 [Anaerolineales bacterium]